MNNKLIENNYLIIPGFIPSYRAVQLSNEFKSYCECSNLEGDPQAPLSHSKYNYISFLELLCEKTQEVSSILEETVLPTYAYSRVYLKDSVLEKHTDRDACEISLTVHLNGDKQWPIFIKTPTGEERSVVLNPGDAMLYLGKIAEHWRDSFDGNYYSQVFLHYVRSRGDCVYAYFDKKKENPKNEVEKEIKEEIETPKSEDTSKSTPTLIVPKPKSRTCLEDYIQVFDNTLPIDLCNEILEEYRNASEWESALVGNGVVNKNYRNCNQILISDQNIIDKNSNKRRDIDTKIHENLGEAVKKYKELYEHFVINIDTGYQLLRYNEGEYYTQHVDSFIEQQRSVSCSLHLNDDYEGGEFTFFDREIIIRAGAGSAILY
jgi:Rps23 Pro-64 3,4-dihydroxylase Tpa1-like proline 4-hydroxylase